MISGMEPPHRATATGYGDRARVRVQGILSFEARVRRGRHLAEVMGITALDTIRDAMRAETAAHAAA